MKKIKKNLMLIGICSFITHLLITRTTTITITNKTVTPAAIPPARMAELLVPNVVLGVVAIMLSALD